LVFYGVGFSGAQWHKTSGVGISYGGRWFVTQPLGWGLLGSRVFLYFFWRGACLWGLVLEAFFEFFLGILRLQVVRGLSRLFFGSFAKGGTFFSPVFPHLGGRVVPV